MIGIKSGCDPFTGNQSEETMNKFFKNNDVHVKLASSVKEYAYVEDKNRKFRNEMEDTFCHKDILAKDESCGLFAVFDGHGGRHVADHCSETFAREFHKEIQKAKNSNLTPIFESVFQKIDKQVKLMDSDKCGATACVAIVRQELNNRVLYVGNVGDTRAVLSRSGKPLRLSKDHKATDRDEISFIKSQGGNIIEGRVAGGLAITRALGDFTYKKYGVSASPFVIRHVLRPQDQHLVIASDGIWDTVSDLQAAQLCTDESKNCKQLAQSIVKLSLEKGSQDNISCMVIKLN